MLLYDKRRQAVNLPNQEKREALCYNSSRLRKKQQPLMDLGVGFHLAIPRVPEINLRELMKYAKFYREVLAAVGIEAFPVAQRREVHQPHKEKLEFAITAPARRRN